MPDSAFAVYVTLAQQLSLSLLTPVGTDILPATISPQLERMGCSREQAETANQAFDEVVRQFLRHWIEQGTGAPVDRQHENELETDLFVEQGALRSFVKHHDDAFEQLLQEPAIARHLLRPGSEVFFQPDAYEPLLAKFERRIYNLAAHREHREVPFRYSPASRQGDYGDSVMPSDLPPGEGREDIGVYFGTRRSDPTALGIMGQQLSSQAALGGGLPVQVLTGRYMTEALLDIRTQTEALAQAGVTGLHAFIIQGRHAADDRHLGAALLLMDPAQPDRPYRIVFCDTLNPNGTPPWWHSFQHKVDQVFPQPEGAAPVSAGLEDGGVKLQRLHDGVPVRHQDIDCAFYSHGMASALIELAQQQPDLLTHGAIAELVSAMTARMPDYFLQADLARSPEVVREVNVIRRWNTGRDALLALVRSV
ncbi:hypothetical protein GCM10027578_29050 [Spirosoma luteolum]